MRLIAINHKNRRVWIACFCWGTVGN